MYEWLTKEIQSIQTPKFHLVEKPLRERGNQLRAEFGKNIPESYITFIEHFGNAKLYRTEVDYYRIEILRYPEKVIIKRTGKATLLIGNLEGNYASVYTSFDTLTHSWPILESDDRGVRLVSASFEDWILEKATRARHKYKASEWKSILAGPRPFLDEEMAIVNARRHFEVRIVGIEDGDILFEVTNQSEITLPYLSVGLRRKIDGSVMGGVWLPVDNLLPGKSCVFKKDCYKKLISAGELEVFARSDPGPEDRHRYWEFKNPK